MDTVILYREGYSYIIVAPKGHILASTKCNMQDHEAEAWAKAYISSFPNWRLEVKL